MSKPVLSIGIIFKDEIRCLERCLRSLGALRETVPCELVMADTGSADGSREIAERYADVLLEFPWIDDFSAARNAVMDRCSGKWFLSIDADEWLDEDIEQLRNFLRRCGTAKENICAVKIRNYATEELNWNHTYFIAARMVRLSTGARYKGKIHEQFDLPTDLKNSLILDRTLLHHDGYICLNNNSEEGRRKLERNLPLIEEELKKSPHKLLLHSQRIDSCGRDHNKILDYVRQAIEGIKARWDGWDGPGVAILQEGIYVAHIHNQPEFAEWLALAEETFPNSIITRTDLQCYAAQYAWNHTNCAEVVQRGREYLKGIKAYQAGDFDQGELAYSILQTVRANVETDMRSFIARSLLYEGQPEEALETLNGLNCEKMERKDTGALAITLLRLHALSKVDTAPLIQEIWEKIAPSDSEDEAARERRDAFVTVCSNAFSNEYRANETAQMEDSAALPLLDKNLMTVAEWKVLSGLPVYRRAYTLFLPLAGLCELGTAAAVLESGDRAEMAELLHTVEDWEAFPASALERALLSGVVFPQPDKPLKLEIMDVLAARLAQNDRFLSEFLEKAVHDLDEEPQALAWVRGLALAAVQTADWKEIENGIALVRAFAAVERTFLPVHYASAMLCAENINLLPPVHRFGWYCFRAFDAIDAGDTAGYVRLLREGLTSCPDMKKLAEFLTGHTPELTAPPPSGELLELADRVRAMLAAYAPDDPAVVALRQSPVYQRVAYLIESTDGSIRQ